MGTKLTAKSFYLELEEVPTFSRLTSIGIEDDTANVFKFAEQYADHVSTSQKETIERLYNTVSKLKNPYSREKQYQQWAAAENVLDIIIWSKSFQEIKQLLSTTEPKT